MMFFFWVLAPCRLVGRCQRFGETYCLHLQGLSGITKTQKTIIILTAVKTSDLTLHAFTLLFKLKKPRKVKLSQNSHKI
jgi:hypothetical protein